MFTGIIQAIGKVEAMQERGGDMRLRIHTGKLPLDDVVLGDSICTSGVCLTVIELPGDGFWADVSVESLNLTTLGELEPGSPVNLEKSLTPESRLGGHIVSGHVDGVGEVVGVDPILEDQQRELVGSAEEEPHEAAEEVELGVQLALAENNWAEAERLLALKEYPSSLNDKVQNLQSQISEIKAQEGKIVIQFTPGTRRIPATAILNRNTYQKFIVDTGASMVTIPRSTAEKLGLAVDERNPLRKIFTAGGVKYAPEVNLFAVTIEGWEVNNIKALVLDLPNQPEWGLLGLNYLQRFQMDINTEKGVMLLEPR